MVLIREFINRMFIFLLIFTILLGSSSAVHAILPAESSSVQNSSTQVRINQNTRDPSGLVKLLTYNIQDAGADKRWINVIQKEDPDIFFLVETGFIENIQPWLNTINSFFPNETPYQAVAFDGTGTTDGEAIFSRYPIVNSSAIYTMTLDDGTTFGINHPIMHAVLNIQGELVHVMTNHLSCCDALDRRTMEQEGIINFIDSLGNVPVIYGGDFNSESPLDIGSIGPFQSNLGTYPLGMMLNMSDPHGPKYIQFTDSYRALNPDRKGWTLNGEGDYFSINHYRDRIDYIFVSQHLVKNLVNSSVSTVPEASVASDHKPVYTWFNFKPEYDFQAPLNPQNVTVDVSPSQTILNWAPVSAPDLVKYNIYRNGSLLDTITAPTTSYTDTKDYQTGVS